MRWTKILSKFDKNLKKGVGLGLGGTEIIDYLKYKLRSLKIFNN